MDINESNEPEEICESCEISSTSCCQSCGMPMHSSTDYGGGNTENVYCVHCCQPDGGLKSYDEVLENMVTLFMKTRNLDRTSAEQSARDYLTSLPAWARR
jgi:hypothetical protein